MDYWQIAYRDALAFLLARHPAVALSTRSPHGDVARNFLPVADRQRLALVSHEQADFYLFDFSPLPSPLLSPYAPVVYTRTAYRSTVVSVAAVNLDRVDAAQAVPYRAAYRSAIARAPAVRARFDIYLDDRAAYWIRDACRPEDTAPKFILHVAPVDPRVLPGRSFENLDFYFYQRGVRFDGKCVAAVPLPAYPIRHMRIGQWLAEADHTLWQADLPVPLAPDAVHAYRAAYRALASAPPTHRGVFDVYLTADRVAAAKDPCIAADTQPRFILHAIPARTRDLPPDRRRAGFVNLDFQFDWQGAHFDGRCLAKPRCRIIPSPVSASASSAWARSRFGLAELPARP